MELNEQNPGHKPITRHPLVKRAFPYYLRPFEFSLSPAFTTLNLVWNRWTRPFEFGHKHCFCCGISYNWWNSGRYSHSKKRSNVLLFQFLATRCLLWLRRCDSQEPKEICLNQFSGNQLTGGLLTGAFSSSCDRISFPWRTSTDVCI